MVAKLVICLGLIGTACATGRAQTGHVDVTYGMNYQLCAERDKEEPKPHSHVRLFASVEGAPIEKGDTLVFVLGNGHQVVFDLRSGIFTLDFPAGLGSHTVDIEWRDVSGKVKTRSQALFSVWDCS